jgi:hypothetical protein
MATEHQGQIVRSRNDYLFSTSISQDPMGGWISRIEFGNGVSVSKWFDAEADARQYPSEIVTWLEERRLA